MEVREPIDLESRRLLRRAVAEHVRSLTGRAFPPVVHVGTPGGRLRRFTVNRDEPTDHALRADIVAAMLGRRRPAPPGSSLSSSAGPWVWLTRAGDLALHDLDVEWLSSSATACAEAGVDLTMVVVTRRGWRDPRSGAGQTWVRLRP
ncbi:hypothetical protein [Nocardioides dilutus]